MNREPPGPAGSAKPPTLAYSSDQSDLVARIVRISLASAALFPVLFALSLYTTWLLAWREIGYRPRPIMDDPANIGGAVPPFFTLSSIFVLLWVPALIASFFIVLFTAVPTDEEGFRFRSASWHWIVTPVVTWSACLVWLLFDGWRLINWIID